MSALPPRSWNHEAHLGGVGSSGSGKTTVARRLAEALSVPQIELDALYWGENWSAATKAELSERVRAATAGRGWVVDGNYWSKIGPQVWTTADTVVWVSPPRELAGPDVLARGGFGPLVGLDDIFTRTGALRSGDE